MTRKGRNGLGSRKCEILVLIANSSFLSRYLSTHLWMMNKGGSDPVVRSQTHRPWFLPYGDTSTVELAYHVPATLSTSYK